MDSNLSMYIGLLFVVLFFTAYGIRFFRNFLAPVRTADATVVHKQTVESFSKYSGTGKHTKYAVTFSVNGKSKSFYVSEFSYRGYRIGEAGNLTYKGDRLIDFH